MKNHFPAGDRYLLGAVAVLAAVAVLIVIVRFLAAPVPLERDEGEYALMGQLILDGSPPYLEAANMKLPGIYYAYSAILAVFGQTPTSIHLGLMAVHLVSTALLFLIATPLFGAAGAALAGAAFMVMSADASVLGLFAHATHFVMLFALAGLLLLQKSRESSHRMPLLLCAGLCFGLSFLMKQSGAFFGLFGLLLIAGEAFRDRPIRWKGLLLDLVTLAFGILLPYALLVALMAWQGVLGRFWFWTVDYARQYATEIDLKTGFLLFRSGISPVVLNNPLIWWLAAAGLIGTWFTKAGRKVAPFLTLFFLFSFLAVCPGLFFRQHYFVQILPAAALGAGAALWLFEELAAKYTGKSRALQFAVLVVIIAFLLPNVYSLGRALTKLTPDQFSRSIYGANPFPESIKVAHFLQENTRPGDHIAVMGSEPQICFYAHRKSATEHIYMYGLMEPQPFALHMQEELISQVERNDPEFLVLVPISTSWLQKRESERKIFSWMNGYLRNYRPVMIGDIYSDRTLWLMDDAAESFTPGPRSNQIIVFKRKSAR